MQKYGIPVTRDVFRFNSKCSLVKLLCTLARLGEGTLLQPLRLDFFGIDFPLHPRSQLPYLFVLIAGRKTRGNARRAHERAPLPNLTTPATIAPPPSSHLSPAQVSARRTISRRRVPLGECFPCISQNALALFFLRYRHDGRGRGGRFDETEATKHSGPVSVGRRPNPD